MIWHGNQTASSNGQWPTGANMQWLPSTDFKKHDRLVVSSNCSVVYPPSVGCSCTFEFVMCHMTVGCTLMSHHTSCYDP
mgnify:CR=1 FL=1